MKIVVVSPHPDDETLGAGGFILKQKMMGNKVYWINMTDVDQVHGWNAEFMEKRKCQIEKVRELYNFDGFYNLKFLPCSLENTDKNQIIDKFSECIRKIEPEWVVLPNPDDAHSDHLITYEVGMSCSKVFRYPYVKRIMIMEILSETDFSKNGNAFCPNYFYSIEEVIEKKLQILSTYNTELGVSPFPRSLEAVKALALLRGGTSGVKYAEAFQMIKQIE